MVYAAVLAAWSLQVCIPETSFNLLYSHALGDGNAVAAVNVLTHYAPIDGLDEKRLCMKQTPYCSAFLVEQLLTCLVAPTPGKWYGHIVTMPPFKIESCQTSGGSLSLLD